MAPKRPASQLPRTRARGELDDPVDDPERILKKRKRNAPVPLQVAVPTFDDLAELSVRQGHSSPDLDEVIVLPADGPQKNSPKRKNYVSIAPVSAVNNTQELITRHEQYPPATTRAAVHPTRDSSKASTKQEKAVLTPTLAHIPPVDHELPVVERKTQTLQVLDPAVRPPFDDPNKSRRTQVENSSVLYSVPPPTVHTIDDYSRKRKRDAPTPNPIPLSFGDNFEGGLGEQQWNAQLANIAGLPLGEEFRPTKRQKHVLPMTTPADRLHTIISSADEQGERGEEVYIKPDPDRPLPSENVVATTELQHEHARTLERKSWEDMMSLLRDHPENRTHHGDLTALQAKQRAAEIMYNVTMESGYVAPGFPEPDTTLQDLDEFVQRFAVHVFTMVWHLHIDQQIDPVLKVAAMIEMKQNQEALIYNREYKLPDEDTSLNWYGRVTGRTRSDEDDAEFCEILGLGQDEQRGRHEGSSDEWNFVGTIGKGGNGHAALWVQYDMDNQIIDRVVSKETWVHASQWHCSGGGVLVNGPTPALLSREAYIQNLLCEKKGSDRSIVEIRASALYGKLYMYRIYTEHCEISGDLENAICRHGTMLEKVDLHGQPLHGRIAEIAIWAVFETLTHAIYLMKHGLPPSKPGRSLLWPNEIVHFDIKPKNVFLKSPHPTDWPTIPQFRLGDYGSSRLIPTRRVPAGTPGYEAPEQGLSWRHCDSAVNVWGVGAVIASLIQVRQNLPIRPGMPTQYRERMVPEDATELAVFTQDDRYFYTKDLLNLVRRCCEIDVRQRIGVDELWREVSAFVTRGPNAIKWRKRRRGESFLYDERAAYESLTR